MSKFRFIGAAAAALLLVSQLVWAGGGDGHSHGPVSDMAHMVSSLNHHPTDGDKTRLKKILADDKATDYEKTIATSLMNMNHSVSAADKAKLKAIADDASAPAGVRELAGVLMNLNHKASADDKAMLKKLAQ